MFTIETYEVQGKVSTFLWLRCDTCIAGFLSAPVDGLDHGVIQTKLLAEAAERKWDTSALCRCPLCVADNWTYPIH
jgi:hypothetical protein